MKYLIQSYKQLDRFKRKLLLISIPSGIIVLSVMVFYVMSIFKPEAETDLNEDPFSRVSFDIVQADSEQTKVTKEKTEAYRLREKMEASLAGQIDDTTIALDSPHDLIVAKQGDKTDKGNIDFNSTVLVENTTPKKQTSTYKKPSAPRKTTVSKKQDQKKEVTQEVNTESKGEENNSDDDGWITYGGIIGGDENNGGGDNPNQVLKELEFFEAHYYDGKVKLKDKSQITFLLHDEKVIQGIKFNKSSKLYAVADFSSNAIYITVNKIQNTDGKSYPITLIGYNENYQKGIYYDGQIEDSKNEGKNELLEDAEDQVGVTGKVVGEVVETSTSTVKNMFSKRKQEYEINSGYIMYFTFENDGI